MSAKLFEQRVLIAQEVVRLRNVLEAASARLRRLEEQVELHRMDVVDLGGDADAARALSFGVAELEMRVRSVINEFDRLTAIELVAEMRLQSVRALDRRDDYC